VLGGIGLGVGGALLATSVVLLVSGDTLFAPASASASGGAARGLAVSAATTQHGGSIAVLGTF
jgi:hypothetical protein